MRILHSTAAISRSARRTQRMGTQTAILGLCNSQCSSLTPFASVKVSHSRRNLGPKQSFLEFYEDVPFFESSSDPAPLLLLHREGLCGAELVSCREEGRDVEVSLFPLSWGLEGYGWTMSAVGGKRASRLIAWSVAG